MNPVSNPFARQWLVLTAGLLVLGVVSALICAVTVGVRGVEAAAWSTGLCLLSGWVVFLFAPLYRLPRQALAGVVIGTTVRMGLTVAGAVMLLSARPEVPPMAFLACLFVQYMAGLTFETILLLKSLGARATLEAIGLA